MKDQIGYQEGSNELNPS